jgi:ABC-type glycerol-3-phosphate transport system substrate-binding protein
VVTIWHSWDDAETQALVTVIQSFQHLYPDVVFDVLRIPLDDLRNTYETAAYNGHGPSLLLAPADWGPAFYDSNLIADLDPYTPPDYLNIINPASLASGQYQNALISLPLSQHGVVMFRNTALIQDAPLTFDGLITAAQRATRGGNIGSYLERGSFFSTANIAGLGGSLMDVGYNPAFNDSFGLEWFDLLTAFDEAGAVTFNTNRDLDMFKLGRVGIIIDGTWNINNLSQAIGSENLAINPWPTYGTGHLSGWVQSDSVYLNINSTGDDRFAALSFIGYLLNPNVQQVLAEVGHIPSVITTQPRDVLIQQAMVAFSNGIPYPITSDNRILTAYWDELDLAIQSVFDRGADPATVLQAASDAITQRLEDLRRVP